MTRTEILLDALHRGHDGDPWHGSSVAAILDGVTVEQAHTRVARDVHTIAEIVAHLISWSNEVTRRVNGHDAADPIEGDWPDVSSTDAAGWKALTQELGASVQRLATAIRQFDPSRWDDLVGDDRDPAAGTGLSFEQTVSGQVQHLAYHGGQIAMLKKIVTSRRAWRLDS